MTNQWTPERLNEFKNYFGLTDKQIAAAIGERTMIVWKMRNDVILTDRYATRLDAYCTAIKKAKRVELESLIEYYEAF